MKNTTEVKYIFQMMNTALTGAVLPNPNSSLDWNYIYELCKKHRVDNIAAYAIEKSDLKSVIPSELRQKFLLAKQKGIAREVVQSFELEQIQAALEKQKIANLPLKGSILKQYYPSPDMRFLTDLDILYPEKQTEQMGQVLIDLGYEISHTGGHHDVYMKKPYMTVEMHRICSTDNKHLNKLLDSIWIHCRKQKGKKYAYMMPWELFYIYMIGHMVKHFQYGGIGIRTVLDLLIFEEKLEKKCDRSYIETELRKAGLLKFEQAMRQKLKKWLDADAPLLENDALLECVLQSGAYGVKKNYMGSRLLIEGTEKKKIVKQWCCVLIEILFPKLYAMQSMYPFLKKYPIFLPIFWIIRWIQKAVTKPIYCIRILQNTMNRKELKRMKKVVKEAGLDKGENDGIL